MLHIASKYNNCSPTQIFHKIYRKILKTVIETGYFIVEYGG